MMRETEACIFDWPRDNQRFSFSGWRKPMLRIPWPIADIQDIRGLSQYLVGSIRAK